MAYLPVITLYGMKLFGILAALLVAAGAGLALYGPELFSLGGCITGVLNSPMHAEVLQFIRAHSS
jgi:hypothetical protein